MKLRIVPTDLKTANDFVRRLHRHSRPVVGYKFAVGVEDETGMLRASISYAIGQCGGISPSAEANLDRLAAMLCPPVRGS